MAPLRVIVGTALSAALVAAFAPAAGAAQETVPMSASLRRELARQNVSLAGLSAYRSRAFPEVVLFRRDVPDAGPFFVGGFVRGMWFGTPEFGAAGDAWDRIARAALLARHWTALGDAQRRDLAQRWIDNELPAGVAVQSGAGNPPEHPPRAYVDGATIVVEAWVDVTRESRGGLVVDRAAGPTRYVFERDGTVHESPAPANGAVRSSASQNPLSLASASRPMQKTGAGASRRPASATCLERHQPMSGIQSTNLSATSSLYATTSSSQSLAPFANLDLTEDQRTKIRSIMQQGKSQGLSQADVEQQVNSVLTPAQQTTLQSDVQNAQSAGSGRHHHHHHGGGGSASSSSSATSSPADPATSTDPAATADPTTLTNGLTATDVQNQARAALSILAREAGYQAAASSSAATTNVIQ